MQTSFFIQTFIIDKQLKQAKHTIGELKQQLDEIKNSLNNDKQLSLEKNNKVCN